MMQLRSGLGARGPMFSSNRVVRRRFLDESFEQALKASDAFAQVVHVGAVSFSSVRMPCSSIRTLHSAVRVSPASATPTASIDTISGLTLFPVSVHSRTVEGPVSLLLGIRFGDTLRMKPSNRPSRCAMPSRRSPTFARTSCSSIRTLRSPVRVSPASATPTASIDTISGLKCSATNRGCQSLLHRSSCPLVGDLRNSCG